MDPFDGLAKLMREQIAKAANEQLDALFAETTAVLDSMRQSLTKRIPNPTKLDIVATYAMEWNTSMVNTFTDGVFSPRRIAELLATMQVMIEQRDKALTDLQKAEPAPDICCPIHGYDCPVPRPE